MGTTLSVEWAPGRNVPVRFAGPDDAPTLIVLAHGAGAGPDHPFMTGVRDRLIARGFGIVTFAYPYVAEGRRAPDRAATLLDAHRAVIARVSRAGARLVLAGRSMGGRISSHLDDVGAAAYVFLAYPLVPMGKAEPRDTSHLARLAAPMLFVQGDRDPLGPIAAIRGVVAALGAATLMEIPDADHGFHVPKRSGLTDDEVLDRIADGVAGWLSDQAGGGR